MVRNGWRFSYPPHTVEYGFLGFVDKNPKKWPRCRNGTPFCESADYIHKPQYHGTIHDIHTVNHIQYRRFWAKTRHEGVGILTVCRSCWVHIKYQRMYDIMMKRTELHVPYRP